MECALDPAATASVNQPQFRRIGEQRVVERTLGPFEGFSDCQSVQIDLHAVSVQEEAPVARVL